jgi:voltage-dependent calcium channel L type alpha-1D
MFTRLFCAFSRKLVSAVEFTSTHPPFLTHVCLKYNGDLDEHANFRDFGTAMLTLFRFATGENWNGFMYNAAEKLPGCNPDPSFDPEMCGFRDRPGCVPLDGCGSDAITPYLYSFCMIVFFVALNLVVGVILDAFQTAASSAHVFVVADMERFQVGRE